MIVGLLVIKMDLWGLEGNQIQVHGLCAQMISH